MPVVHLCSTAGCHTLTMGRFCLQCEDAQRAEELADVLDRGRIAVGRGELEARAIGVPERATGATSAGSQVGR